MPAMSLIAENYKPVFYFCNPNIHPLMEYLKRREAAAICAEKLKTEIIFDDDAYRLADWLKEQTDRQNVAERCKWCTAGRLKKTMQKAKELGISCYSTSLLYSRYQPHEYIAQKGALLNKNTENPEFIYRDFRIYWQEGIDRSKQMELYRQAYCGCIFSENERYAKKLARL